MDNERQGNRKQLVSVLTQTDDYQNLVMRQYCPGQHRQRHNNNSKIVETKQCGKPIVQNCNQIQPASHVYNTTQSIIQQYNTARPVFRQDSNTRQIHMHSSVTKTGQYNHYNNCYLYNNNSLYNTLV